MLYAGLLYPLSAWAFHVFSVGFTILPRQREFVSAFGASSHAALNNRFAAAAGKGSAVAYVKCETAFGAMNYVSSLCHEVTHSTFTVSKGIVGLKNVVELPRLAEMRSMSCFNTLCSQSL